MATNKTPPVPPVPPPLPPAAKQTNNNSPPIALGKAQAKWRAPRIVLTVVEGWGKTSCGAYAPDATILMADGETGYETLLASSLVPIVTTGSVTSWQALLNLLCADVWDNCETLVIDALGGIERACQQYVCDTQFKGNWGEQGFVGYQRGYEVSAIEWVRMLAALDHLNQQDITILLLAHAKVQSFKNPLGADYDKYVADVHHKTWTPTKEWADAVLFGNFYTVVETQNSKTPEALRRGKGIGGTERVIYTERRDAFDAKNRYGMRPVLDIPNDPSTIWTTIYSAICAKSKEHNHARTNA